MEGGICDLILCDGIPNDSKQLGIKECSERRFENKLSLVSQNSESNQTGKFQ